MAFAAPPYRLPPVGLDGLCTQGQTGLSAKAEAGTSRSLPFVSSSTLLHRGSLSLGSQQHLQGRGRRGGRGARRAECAAASAAVPEMVKEDLLEAVQGIDKGIFGLTPDQEAHILGLISQLEANNPTEAPTSNLEKVNGRWRLLYSTITILGGRRTKLGLRDFIKLTDFLQIINTEKSIAENRVEFEVGGFWSGALTIQAGYEVASPTKVNIEFRESSIVPEQLLALFKKNYDLLLSIFNPEGWLEITYVDERLRVGRDDKGNVFLLERVVESQ